MKNRGIPLLRDILADRMPKNRQISPDLSCVSASIKAPGVWSTKPESSPNER